MVDLRKAVLFPAGHCQKLSPMQTSDTSQAEFQPEQNLSSGFITKWSFAVVITTTQRHHMYTTIHFEESLKKKFSN